MCAKRDTISRNISMFYQSKKLFSSCMQKNIIVTRALHLIINFLQNTRQR